ncbi:MAG: tetratricopeptide repeat protein [Nitrospira sp.]|nr:tetratricopeptide repeat protein [Nitrospira sp.]
MRDEVISDDEGNTFLTSSLTTYHPSHVGRLARRKRHRQCGPALLSFAATGGAPMPNPRIEPLKKILAMDPNDDVAWFGLGKAYLDDGNFEEAATALRQCVTVKPTYSAAYFALAQALQKLNRLDECRTVCATGIDISTKNGDAMVTKNLEALKSSLPQ